MTVGMAEPLRLDTPVHVEGEGHAQALQGQHGVATGVPGLHGVVETFEAGDAFVIEPGHVPVMSAGGEFVAFTPTDEARQQMAVMMPNIMRYAQENGIELPAMATPA